MNFQVEQQRIERLLRHKFPGSWAPPPIGPVGRNKSELYGGPEDGASHRKMMEDIAAARAVLWAMPAPERDAQYEALLAAEAKRKRLLAEMEEFRFSFNQRDAFADFEYWVKVDSWSLDETVALLLGRAPEKVKWSSVQSCVNVSTFAKDFSRLRELGVRSKALNHGVTSNELCTVLDWAEGLDIPIPEGLTAAFEKRRAKASASRASVEITTQRGDGRPIEDVHGVGETVPERQDRRLARLRDLGGDVRRVSEGLWVQATKSGALSRLVLEEVAATRPRSDSKDIRTGLSAAAEREWERAKQGAFDEGK